MPNYTNRKLYRRINALDKKVKQQSETRYFEQLQIGSISTTGTLYLLNGLQQGDQGFNREGDWVTINKIKIKGNVVGTDATNIYRMIVFIDYQCNGAAPTMAQLLDLSVGSPPTLAYRNPEYFERFTVLHDEFYSLVLGSDTQQRLYSVNLSTNLKTNYSLGNAGTINDISRGAIYLLCVSDSSAATHPGINIVSRIKFVA